MAASENFRKNLATILKARELSKADLARALSPDDEDAGRRRFPYVHRVLSGDTIPGLDQCETIANAVGMPLTALLLSPRDFESAVLTVLTK